MDAKDPTAFVRSSPGGFPEDGVVNIDDTVLEVSGTGFGTSSDCAFHVESMLCEGDIG